MVLEDFYKTQALVVQKLDSAIHWINRSLEGTSCAISWIVIYPMDSAFYLSNNWGLVNH